MRSADCPGIESEGASDVIESAKFAVHGFFDVREMFELDFREIG